MSKRLRVLRGARLEVAEAADRYAAESPALRDRFLRELGDAVASVFEAPYRWTEHEFGSRWYVLLNFPFSIIYFDDAEEVVIAAVAHHSRRPGYWKRRRR